MTAEPHDRSYFQSRIREEIDRADRYGHVFSVIVFEAQSAGDGIPVRRQIEHALTSVAALVRPSDVVAKVFEDAVAVLLIETDAAGARDALFRMRNRIAAVPASWRVTSLTYPRDAEALAELPLLRAA